MKLPEAVLRERVRDVSYNGWFYLPDGKTPDPLWATLKQRCRQRLKVSDDLLAQPLSTGRPGELSL